MEFLEAIGEGGNGGFPGGAGSGIAAGQDVSGVLIRSVTKGASVVCPFLPAEHDAARGGEAGHVLG